MHVALLLRLPADEIVDSVNGLSNTPLVVSLPGEDAERLVEEGVDLSSVTNVDWARTGWSQPWFPMLPEAEIDRQLTREASVFATLGLEPGPLVVDGPWVSSLVTSFSRNSVTSILLPVSHVGRPGTGVVSHLAEVLACVGVCPPEALDDDLSEEMQDDLIVIECTDLSDTRMLAEQVRNRIGQDLTTVTSFFAHHRANGRLSPKSIDWEHEIKDDTREIHHRKLVRLITRVPDRISDATEVAILRAQSGAAFAGEAPVPHEPLVEARRAIDDDRRRGQDWGKVTRLDWNVDGRDEVHVELPDLSFVVVPHRSAAIASLDLKRPIWPISALADEPGWDLVRYVTDLEELGPVPIEFDVESVSETKGGDVTMQLDGLLENGSIECILEAGHGQLRVTYRLHDMPPGWIGPELRVTMANVESRTDGSEWRPITEPTVTSGHRIRLQGGDRQLSIESLSPIRCFIRPAIGGLVAWPHWVTQPTSTFQVTIRVTQTPPIGS